MMTARIFLLAWICYCGVWHRRRKTRQFVSVFGNENQYHRSREAVFQLKYLDDQNAVHPLAKAVAEYIVPRFPSFGLIVTMPASNPRPLQPVTSVAKALGALLNKPVFDNMLVKAPGGPSLKNLDTRAEKDAALANQITLYPAITTMGRWNVLLLDDLYHSGASLDAACRVLRTYAKIADIYVATVFCTGDTPRNNVGDWHVHNVTTYHKPGTRAFFTAKDLAMAEAADSGFMIWDTKSTGTLANVFELLSRKKYAWVFIQKDKIFQAVKNAANIEALIAGMSTSARMTADTKIGLTQKLADLQSRQQQFALLAERDAAQAEPA